MIEKKFYDYEKNIKKIDSIYFCLTNNTLLSLNKQNNSFRIIAVFSKTEFKIDTEIGEYIANLRQKTDSTIIFNYYKPNTEDSDYWRTFKKDVGIIDESIHHGALEDV